MRLFDYSVGFASPQYLWLLLLIPVLWWVGRNSLRGLGRVRRAMAILLRTAVATAIVLAMAEMEFVRTQKQTTVMFLVDRSLSIPDSAGQASIAYIERVIQEQLDRTQADRAGVIVFGREASIELPPLADNIPERLRIETVVDGEFTDLGKALRLAAATFPEYGARRVVIISDGNENLGTAREEAERMTAVGIGIDVVPVIDQAASDVAVERVSTPQEVRLGEPFDVRVTLSASDLAGNATASGRVRVMRTFAGESQLLSEQQVALAPGQHVFSIREQIDAPDFYTYEAHYIPDDAGLDRFRQNNRAATTAYVRGRGRVLVIEDSARRGSSSDWVEQLRENELEVEVVGSDRAFATMGDLQRYDSVVMHDVPRYSDGSPEEIGDLSDHQISMLVQNTRELGSGLVLLGGPNSFGAGGWANTELEKAMPVDFQIKGMRVVPSGALMLVIDRSGSMADQKLAMAKLAAREATRVLGPQDYIGVVTFDTAAEWAVPMQQVRDRERIVRRIADISIGGGTNLHPGMTEGFAALHSAKASVKHMIILTDGQTEQADYVGMARRMRRLNMTVTCVAIGDDADNHLLNRIALEGGGKFYHIRRPNSIPRIFMKEAVRVARPLIYEDPAGFQPEMRIRHEILSGAETPLPPLTGFVMTTVKENPLVEVPLVAPRPSGANGALLATWTYGVGRTVAWTSDMGERWAGQWSAWPGYNSFLAQMVRWSLRPTDDQHQFAIATRHHGERIDVVVSALDTDAHFEVGQLLGNVVDPLNESNSLRLTQVAPGRFVGGFAVKQSGDYFVSVQATPGAAPLRAAINVPYSNEFTNREANEPLLRELASLVPKDGAAGEVIESESGLGDLEALLSTDVFRRGLARGTSRRDGWHLLLLLGAVLFFFDVANRRLQLELQPALRRLAASFKRTAEPVSSPSMARLRSAKATVAERLETWQVQAGSAAASPETSREMEAARAQAQAVPAAAKAEQATLSPAEEEGTYTSRLLAAKYRTRSQQLGDDQRP